MPKPSLIVPMPGRHAARVSSWIRSPRGLILLAAVPVIAALALGWPWLVAAGIAPLLLAAAPCLAMCALGLCMMGRSERCSTAPNHSIKPGKDNTDA